MIYDVHLVGTVLDQIVDLVVGGLSEYDRAELARNVGCKFEPASQKFVGYAPQSTLNAFCYNPKRFLTLHSAGVRRLDSCLYPVPPTREESFSEKLLDYARDSILTGRTLNDLVSSP